MDILPVRNTGIELVEARDASVVEGSSWGGGERRSREKRCLSRESAATYTRVSYEYIVRS